MVYWFCLFFICHLIVQGRYVIVHRFVVLQHARLLYFLVCLFEILLVIILFYFCYLIFNQSSCSRLLYFNKMLHSGYLSAVHKQMDDAPRFGGEVRGLMRFNRRGRRVFIEAGQGQRAQSHAAARQEFTSRYLDGVRHHEI